MKGILRYLKDYKKESVMAPLFKMLEACFELLIPIVMSKIIDIGIKNGDMGYVLRMCLVMILLGVIGLVCSITAQYFSAKAATGFGTALRSDLFRHITSLSYNEIDDIGTSTLLTRMTSDTNQIQTGVNLVLRLFLRSPFIVFGAMIMSFTIDVKSAMTFVVTIPLLSIVIFGIMIATIPLFKKVQSKLDKVMLLTRENLEGARVIRAFNRQEKEIEEFDKSTDDLMGVQLFVGRISAFLNPVTYVIINLATVVIIWLAAGQTDKGIITQGQVVALVNYMSQILVELVKLANLIINITKSIACSKRIEAVFATQPSIQGGSGVENTNVSDNQHKVIFKNACLRYGKAKEDSLTGIDFTVDAGQTVGIIGGTGSGKSSLVNLIPRFYDATEGSVMIDGTDVKDYTLEELRMKVGVVPQKAVLFKGTIAENIRWGKQDATDEEINDALDIAQAGEFVKAKEGGINFQVSQGGKNLSGGQKQRLTIARAVVRKPEILILDDSASALDFATDAALRRAIKEQTGNMTVFIVSQRASTIMGADKIIVMDDGHVAGIGTHDELLKTCDVYKEICQSQMSLDEAQGQHVQVSQPHDKLVQA
jgi:ABC-type multidrug transport system fused ATPase/permease subunit